LNIGNEVEVNTKKMAKVQIYAQIQENYGWHNDQFHWKNKGQQIFEIDASTDGLLYADKDILDKSFQELLDVESDNMFRYIYINHEIIFLEPIKINTNIFEIYEKLSNLDK